MKSFILTAVTILLFTNCKKDIDNSNCKLEQKSYGALGNLYKYEYDAMNRISKITLIHYSGAIFITVLTYYPDSVIAFSGFERQVYFLNNNGLADSSNLVSPIGSPTQIKYKYTYNAEGQLIKQNEIFSHFSSGNTIFDTTIKTYTVANGNLVKATSTQSPDDITYEYFTDLRPSNNFELLTENDKFSFLQSKNITANLNIIIIFKAPRNTWHPGSRSNSNNGRKNRNLYTSWQTNAGTFVSFP